MKRQLFRKPIFISLGLVALILTESSRAETSLQTQQHIIENYMYVTGQRQRLPGHLLAVQDSLGELPPIKCGMSAIADFVLNYDELDRGLMKALGVTQIERPTVVNEETYDSPGGFFKIHFARTGEDAVYQADVDNNGNGIPDYIDTTASVFDSVYNHIVNVLGYPSPPSDGPYNGGGDGKYDIYIRDLPGGIYGQAWIENYTTTDTFYHATSFIDLDRNYEHLTPYVNRPLDAIRVTAAHEFFHAVQFGIDFTETPIYEDQSGNQFVARYWMEMSAVWMEEEMYDDINDYYLYLPYFFLDTLPYNAYPYQSIQQFKSFIDVHPYACGIFPIFLSETFGRDIIRDIWFACEELGPEDQFLVAANQVIDSISDGAWNWATAFREFVLWNYFTGPRADLAPEGVGYPERRNFPGFREVQSVIPRYYDYPVFQFGNNNPLSPRHNSAAYVRFVDPDLISGVDTTYLRCSAFRCDDSTRVNRNEIPGGLLRPPYFRFVDTSTCDTTFWRCDSYDETECVDSVRVEDPLDGYQFVRIDSVFDVWAALGDGICRGLMTLPQPWGLSIIFQMKDNQDEYAVERLFLPDDATSHLELLDVEQYKSITLAFSPASPERALYRPHPFYYAMDLGYFAEDQLEVDSSAISRPSAVLTPYPNPAVVSEMSGRVVRFRFQIATDSNGVPFYPDSIDGDRPHIVVDIYNVAGERVRTVSGYSDFVISSGIWELNWDMKNEARDDVAAGVYICYARLYSAEKKGELLAEDHAKVAIIR